MNDTIAPKHFQLGDYFSTSLGAPCSQVWGTEDIRVLLDDAKADDALIVRLVVTSYDGTNRVIVATKMDSDDIAQLHSTAQMVGDISLFRKACDKPQEQVIVKPENVVEVPEVLKLSGQMIAVNLDCDDGKFMQPETVYGTFYALIVDSNDAEMIPEDILWVTLRELVETSVSIEIVKWTGWFGRMSAPGYTDCTEWGGPYETQEEALNELSELYGDDDEPVSEEFAADGLYRKERQSAIEVFANMPSEVESPEFDYEWESSIGALTLMKTFKGETKTVLLQGEDADRLHNDLEDADEHAVPCMIADYFEE